MKIKFYIALGIAFSFLHPAVAQTAPATADIVAVPSAACVGGTQFAPPAGYTPTPTTPQLGVNNTGTDICQLFGFDRVVQAMV